MSNFKVIPLPKGYELKLCPFCGSAAELYDVTDDFSSSKVVTCTHAGDLPDSTDECPMYLPSSASYKATKKEAIEIWNKRAGKEQ
jgi:hypothetical protein